MAHRATASIGYLIELVRVGSSHVRLMSVMVRMFLKLVTWAITSLIVPDGASVATLPTPSPDDVEVCDRYCMLLNGPSSYCKWWQSPAVCHSGGQPCGDVTICLAPIIGTSTYDLVGDQHGGPSPACDSYCQDLNDESSYCKYWQNPAVCLSGDQPCGPSVCDTTTSVVSVSTTPTPTTIPALSTTLVSDTSSVRTTFTSPLFGGDSDSTATTFDGCDTYCKALNNEYSYCKYWLDKPVCQSGEQPCGLSVC